MKTSSDAKIEAFLTSKWGLLVQIITPVLTIAWFGWSIQTSQLLQQKDVQYIKDEIVKIETNHLAHIQDAIESIKDIIGTLSAKEEKTEALLSQHLNSKP